MGNFEDGGPKSKAFMVMLENPEFQKLGQCVVDKLEQLRRLSLLLEHEVDGPVPGKTAPALRDEPEMLSLEYRARLEESVNAVEQIDFSQFKNDKFDLVADPLLKLSLVISCCRAILDDMTEMQHKFLND